MLRIVSLVAAIFFTVVPALGQTAEPFGIPLKIAFAKNDHGWKRAMHDIQTERLIIAHCRMSTQECPGDKRQAVFEFIKLVNDAAVHTGLARIGWLNRGINLAIRPMEAGCLAAQRWTAPLKTLQESCGDCKEFAIAKAVGLRELGFLHVRIVVGKIPSIDQYHAVVAVRFETQWLVLDDRTLEIVPADAEKDFVALYSLEISGPLPSHASN